LHRMCRAGKPPRLADDWYLCINKRVSAGSRHVPRSGAAPWITARAMISEGLARMAGGGNPP